MIRKKKKLMIRVKKMKRKKTKKNLKIRRKITRKP
jgi:hypothetical protein